MLTFLAAIALARSARAPVVDPHWKFAYENQGNSIWYSTADGKYDHLLIRHGRAPRWSPDGRRIAYVRNREIRIRTLSSGKDELLTRIEEDDIRDAWGGVRWSDRDDDHPAVYLDWDPCHPVVLLSTESSTSVRLVPTIPSAQDEDDSDQSQRIFGHFMAATNTAVWSTSGRWLAFAKAGDIWLASREHPASTGVESGHFQAISSEYYDVARRLCALAYYNENDASGSATTPYFVTELAWTKDARRLVYLKRRIGGGGYDEIGYLQFTKPGAGLLVQDDPTAYVLHSHLCYGYCPRVCPDGKTLSYICGGLVVSDWDGRHQQLIKKGVLAYDWRPG